MKVDVIDELSFVVFLNKCYVKNVDFEDKEELERYFKSLFLTLKNSYHIDVSGFFNVNVYLDNNYGVILDIEKEDIDYIEYGYNQVDMRIVISDNKKFLYEIKDLEMIRQYTNNINLYSYSDRFYFEILDQVDINNIIEHVNIIYGDVCNDIVNRGSKIDLKEVII